MRAQESDWDTDAAAIFQSHVSPEGGGIHIRLGGAQNPHHIQPAVRAEK